MEFVPCMLGGQLEKGNPLSNVAILCLWSLRSKVAARLSPSHYAAIGNLYSSVLGLSPLIRNLLYNPQITTLILTGSDLTRSGQAVRDLFAHGVRAGTTELGRPAWVVNSEVPGYLDKEIDLEAIELLRSRVKLLQSDLANLSRTAEENHRDTAVDTERLVFEAAPQPESEYWPTHGYGYVVRDTKVARAWLKLLDLVQRYGTDIHAANYDSGTREALSVLTVITDEDPDNPYLPSYLTCDESSLAQYLPQIMTTGRSPDGKYTYGDRTRGNPVNQIDGVIQVLASDPTARFGYVDLWRIEEDLGSRNAPCWDNAWFRLQPVDNGFSLFARTYFRSHETYNAWPLNMLALRHVQAEVAAGVSSKLGVPVTLGPLANLSDSLHLYNPNLDNAKLTVQEAYEEEFRGKLALDPLGNYQVEASDGQLTLRQLNPGSNEPLREFLASTPAEMGRIVTRYGLASDPGHAFYLGCEVQKAAESLRQGGAYQQDTDT